MSLLVVGCAQKTGWSHVTHLGADERTDWICLIFKTADLILSIEKTALEVTILVIHVFNLNLVALDFESAFSITQAGFNGQSLTTEGGNSKLIKSELFALWELLAFV